MTRTPKRSDAPDARIHRALSNPVRMRLLEVLDGEPDVDAATLAERVGLHVNTVRTHLGVLEEAGLVEPLVEQRDRPGRPRLLYRAAQPDAIATEADDQDSYRFLAGILASYLEATAQDGGAAAEAAGSGWGSYVVASPAPFTTLEPAAAIERLVAMLDELGFEPQLDDEEPGRPRLLLRRCPFLEVAREHQEVVCSVHLGLMRGALAELGADVEAEDLIPWAQPEQCVSHLRIPAATCGAP